MYKLIDLLVGSVCYDHADLARFRVRLRGGLGSLLCGCGAVAVWDVQICADAVRIRFPQCGCGAVLKVRLRCGCGFECADAVRLRINTVNPRRSLLRNVTSAVGK